MKAREWAIFIAAVIVLGLAYSDAQRGDEQSAFRDIAAASGRGGP